MTEMRALYHLAKADFLERVRRYSFLITLAFAVYLGVAAARGQISLRLRDYSGVPNSAWVGALMSMTTTVFLSLVGFFIVANSVQRDEQTRVGRILASTPMNRFAYTLAKALSNFAVLASMVAVLVVAGVVIVLIEKAAPLHWWELLAPFLFIALPAMAITAAIAVFFEATPVIRRVSAFIYFFFWIFALASATKYSFLDFTGMNLVSTDMIAALRRLEPGYPDAISFGFIAGDLGAAAQRKLFLWSGISWNLALISKRLLLFPAAAAIALIPALWFHRFDPSQEWSRRKKTKETPSSELAWATFETQNASHTLHPSQWTQAKTQPSILAIYFGLFVCELRLLVSRRSWWMYAIGAGLLIASFLAPMSASQGLVAAIWIAPMMIWSRLGAREDFFDTRALIFSAPGATLRPLLASWLAGSCLPLAMSSGFVLRLLVAGDLRAALSLIAGALFVVALALALGNVARTPRVFEAVYVVWWYIGPLQALPGMDFAGMNVTSAHPLRYGGLAILLIMVAWGTRVLRLLRA